MGIDDAGQTSRLVREQSKRLSHCRLTFLREAADGTFVPNGSFVRDPIPPDRDGDPRPERETVRLDEEFYTSLIDQPMWISEAAIRQIGRHSVAMDVYVWLASELHQLSEPTSLSWPAVFAQFGGGYAQLKHFKPAFKEPLALALAAYPEAKIAADDAGLTLYPSPPSIAERGNIRR